MLSNQDNDSQQSIISKLFRAFYSRQFLLFVAFSGFAAAVNVGSRILFQALLGKYVPAIILSYLCGMATAFILNRSFNFKSGKLNLRNQVISFSVINLLGMAQTLAISLFALKYFMPLIQVEKYGYFFSHLLGVAAPTLTSYLGHRYITFGKRTFGEYIQSFRK
jgi:putative flippase GtrA